MSPAAAFVPSNGNGMRHIIMRRLLPFRISFLFFFFVCAWYSLIYYNSDRKWTCRRTSAAERLRLFSDFWFYEWLPLPQQQSEFINEVLLLLEGKERRRWFQCVRLIWYDNREGENQWSESSTLWFEWRTMKNIQTDHQLVSTGNNNRPVFPWATNFFYEIIRGQKRRKPESFHSNSEIIIRPIYLLGRNNDSQQTRKKKRRWQNVCPGEFWKWLALARVVIAGIRADDDGDLFNLRGINRLSTRTIYNKKRNWLFHSQRKLKENNGISFWRHSHNLMME